jgi:predicted metal-dependent enzyme (double-stranded beta helix superfamily)
VFVIEEFVAACRGALAEGPRAAVAVSEEIDRATSRPHALEAAVGDLAEAPSFETWHRSPELTILHVVWPPAVDLFAHDHRMWAAIGLYGGREDNTFYRRDDDGRLEARGDGVSLRAGDSVVLGSQTIHSVANPSREWTGSIHVYGGDYFSPGREMWPQVGGTAAPFDSSQLLKVLDAASTAART